MSNLLILVVVIGVLMLIAGAIVGLVIFLVQMGVIAREAGRPAHRDTNNYSLSQGREAGRTDTNTDDVAVKE